MTVSPAPANVNIELEERIAEMAPDEPDILILFEAIRVLEERWQLNLNIEVSYKSKTQAQTILRQKIPQGKGTLYSNMGITGGNYTNSCQFAADTYEIIYSNFVAAAYGFCGKVPSTRYRGTRIS
jgi:hypothetical protein